MKEEKETKKVVKKWIVSVPFFDNKQKREVSIGEEVEHTPRREELKLIELK